MSLANDPRYPTRRVYLLKLRQEATRDALCGRIENIVTCRQQDFASAAELLQLIGNEIDAPGTLPDAR